MEESKENAQKNNKSQRAQFLLNRHSQLWSNIDRSMRGIWNILATITLVGAILVSIQKEYLPLSLGAILAFGVIFWGINMAIELNVWHRRNLFFLATIENQFLEEEDYGKVLPRDYKTPPNKWIRFYFINVITFIVLLLVIAVYVGYKEISSSSNSDRGLSYDVWHWIILVLGILVTLINAYLRERSAQKRHRELFGN